MKTRKVLIFIGILVLALACEIPGMGQPIPLDPNTLPTIVVLTASAAMTQTAAPGVPTGQMPTISPVPPPTSVVTVTNLEVQSDGSTKFTHVNGGYEVTFPAGWLTVRPNSDEFNAAYSKEATKNSGLKYEMDQDMEYYDAEFDQLFSYALRPDLQENVMFGYSDVDWDSKDYDPIDEFVMGDLIDEIETSGTIPGFRLDTAQVYTTLNMIRLIELGGQFSVSDEQDGFIPLYSTLIYFKPTNSSLVRITFTYLKDYKSEIYPDVGQVINSIRLLGQ